MMPAHSIRLQAKVLTDGLVLLKALIRHPNDNGLSRSPAGALIPAHHITEIIVTVNDQPVVTLHTGSGLAANPLLGWKIKAHAGDKVALTWRDNLDERGQSDVTIPA